MKIISKLFTLLLLVAMSISYVSCGGDDNETIINPNEQPNNNGNNNNNNNNNNNDDNDDTEEVSIVGTWKYVFDKYEGKECYCLFILHKNGEGYIFEEDWFDEEIAERYAEKISYEYDYPLLTVYYEEGDKEYIKIDFINEDIFESDWDGEECIWKRQKESYDNTSIIGYWQRNGDIKYVHGYCFENDGKLYDWDKGNGPDELGYEYSAPNLTIFHNRNYQEDYIVKFISEDIFLLDGRELYDEYYVDVYVRSQAPFVGTWTVTMDDPSWKTVIELKSNGQCIAKDYYDINGDGTYSEYSGKYIGSYHISAMDSIEFIFDEDDCSIIMGEYTFDTLTDDYFDAYDSDDWYIYATKN